LRDPTRVGMVIDVLASWLRETRTDALHHQRVRGRRRRLYVGAAERYVPFARGLCVRVIWCSMGVCLTQPLACWK
jgi:hypothetical protein